MTDKSVHLLSLLLVDLYCLHFIQLTYCLPFPLASDEHWLEHSLIRLFYSVLVWRSTSMPKSVLFLCMCFFLPFFFFILIGVYFWWLVLLCRIVQKCCVWLVHLGPEPFVFKSWWDLSWNHFRCRMYFSVCVFKNVWVLFYVRMCNIHSTKFYNLKTIVIMYSTVSL